MRKYILACMLFTALNSLNAQTSKSDPVDVQGWYGTGLKLNMKKDWKTSFDYQARFINNLKTYKGSYLSAEVSKRVFKFLELQAGYRITLVDKAIYHRMSGGGQLSAATKKIDWGFRLLFQNQVQDYEDPAMENDNSGYWRTRFSASYQLSKKIEPYISIEPIMKFGGTHFVDNWRNTIGTKLKLAKNTKLDIFYIYRPDYAKASYNRTFHIMGASVDFYLKSRTK